jgi:thiol-disulfide isomerase/thioredoxin
MSALLVLILQSPSPTIYTGTLNGHLISESRMIGIELEPSRDLEVPGLVEGDRAYSATIEMFKQPSAPRGLAVVLVEGSGGSFLFIDVNLDGRLAESERIPYKLVDGHTDVQEVSFNVRLDAPDVSLPVRGQVFAEKRDGATVREFLFTPVFRVEGHADIEGRRTLVSLPFKLPARTIDVRNGQLGIDTNGDGSITSASLSPEMVSADGENLVLRAGDRYVSFESADLKSRTVTLRGRAKAEYTLIEGVVGSPVQDFSFIDFDGKEGRLSDYRGKYVLLDFWGSWCKPCVTDVPAMKEAHERFRDKGFEILGLDFENGNKSDSVRPFLKDKAITWRNATPESVKDLIEKRFRVSGFPTLLLLDPNGIVLETRSNELRGDRLIPTLERFMKQH